VTAAGHSLSAGLVSPIILDLNDDGITTTTLANGVKFDLMATGKKFKPHG